MITRDELVRIIAEAIATKEGFYVTQAGAAMLKIAWPTRAQRNYNPGNLRSWTGWPVWQGYAKFVHMEGK